MKKIVILFLIVATIMGCSKDNDDTLSKNSCVVASIHYNNGFNDSEYDFDYDSKGRVIRVRETFAGSSLVHRNEYRFDYQDETIIAGRYTDQGALFQTNTYYLEKNKVAYVDHGSDKTEYEYNSTNLISKYSHYIGGHNLFRIGNIEYSNDNILSINKNEGQTSNLKNKYEYNYNTNEPRMPFIEYCIRLYGNEIFMGDLRDAVLYDQGYFGHKIKNQVTGYTCTEYDGPNTFLYTATVEYGAKDAKGNFTSAKHTSKSQLSDHRHISTINLTYKCD